MKILHADGTEATPETIELTSGPSKFVIGERLYVQERYGATDDEPEGSKMSLLFAAGQQVSESQLRKCFPTVKIPNATEALSALTAQPGLRLIDPTILPDTTRDQPVDVWASREPVGYWSFDHDTFSETPHPDQEMESVVLEQVDGKWCATLGQMLDYEGQTPVYPLTDDYVFTALGYVDQDLITATAAGGAWCYIDGNVILRRADGTYYSTGGVAALYQNPAEQVQVQAKPLVRDNPEDTIVGIAVTGYTSGWPADVPVRFWMTFSPYPAPSVAGPGGVARGYDCRADVLAYAEGWETNASGLLSHTEGRNTAASGEAAHAEGKGTVASGKWAHAEGENTTASGEGTHAEGMNTQSTGWQGSHAEGINTIASGGSSHAEGQNTVASGGNSHAEGWYTRASGTSSHAAGQQSLASGVAAHAAGIYSHARGSSHHAIGGGMLDYTQTVPDTFDKGLGQAQYVTAVLQPRRTTNATPAELAQYFDVPLAPERAIAVRGMVVARKSGGTAAAAWSVSALVLTDAAGAVTIVNPVYTSIGTHGDVTGWAVALVGLAGSKLRVMATGAAATTIDWSANIEMQEVY